MVESVAAGTIPLRSQLSDRLRNDTDEISYAFLKVRLKNIRLYWFTYTIRWHTDVSIAQAASRTRMASDMVVMPTGSALHC